MAPFLDDEGCTELVSTLNTRVFLSVVGGAVEMETVEDKVHSEVPRHAFYRYLGMTKRRLNRVGMLSQENPFLVFFFFLKS